MEPSPAIAPAPAPVAAPSSGINGSAIMSTVITSLITGAFIGAGFIISQKLLGKTISVQEKKKPSGMSEAYGRRMMPPGAHPGHPMMQGGHAQVPSFMSQHPYSGITGSQRFDLNQWINSGQPMPDLSNVPD